jgi:hypothetical protein
LAQAQAWQKIGRQCRRRERDGNDESRKIFSHDGPLPRFEILTIAPQILATILIILKKHQTNEIIARRVAKRPQYVMLAHRNWFRRYGGETATGRKLPMLACRLAGLGF